MPQENTAKVRPAVPRRVWYFEAHDWGNPMAAHDAARTFFDQLRAIKHERIEEAARFMRTKTCLLAEFENSPGVVRGWAVVEEPADEAIQKRVRPDGSSEVHWSAMVLSFTS